MGANRAIALECAARLLVYRLHALEAQDAPCLASPADRGLQRQPPPQLARARRDRRLPSDGRGAAGRRPGRARHLHGDRAQPHRRPGGAAGARRPRQPPQARRRRCLHARVRPDLRGRHHPDVPRRGAAAHPRQGHRRRADRREDRRRTLGEASRPFRQPVRQCLHLRPDDHGPRGEAGRGQGLEPGGGAQAPGGPLGRAVHPQGACARP